MHQWPIPDDFTVAAGDLRNTLKRGSRLRNVSTVLGVAQKRSESCGPVWAVQQGTFTRLVSCQKILGIAWDAIQSYSRSIMLECPSSPSSPVGEFRNAPARARSRVDQVP